LFLPVIECIMIALVLQIIWSKRPKIRASENPLVRMYPSENVTIRKNHPASRQLYLHSIASSFLLDRPRQRKPHENTCPRDSLRLDCRQIRDLRPIAASLLKSHPRNTFSTPVVALTT
jgi:hypothetical protein